MIVPPRLSEARAKRHAERLSYRSVALRESTAVLASSGRRFAQPPWRPEGIAHVPRSLPIMLGAESDGDRATVPPVAVRRCIETAAAIRQPSPLAIMRHGRARTTAAEAQ